MALGTSAFCGSAPSHEQHVVKDTEIIRWSLCKIGYPRGYIASRSDRLRQAFKRFLHQTHMMEHGGMGGRGIACENCIDDLFVFLVRAGNASLSSKLRSAEGCNSPSQSGRKIGNDGVVSTQIDLRMQREVGVGESFPVILHNELGHGLVKT